MTVGSADDARVRVELPDTGTGERLGRRRRRQQWRSITFAVCLVVLVGTGVALTAVGVTTVRDSTAGKRFDPKNDPAEPGFEAFVTPTPTMVVTQVDDDRLVSVTLLSLGNGDAGGGSVVFVPPATVGSFGQYGPLRLDVAHDRLGSGGVLTGLQNVLFAGITESVEVDSERWTRLVAPVAPLRFENPDDLPAADDGRAFAAGELELAADEVGAYLAARAPDESDFERMVRHQVLWEAWLKALGSAGPDAIAGEVESGLGRFLRTLVRGQTSVSTLPVNEGTGADEGGGEGPAFTVRDDEVRALVAAAIPFPTGPSPGARTRVRLLSGVAGTAGTSAREQAARALVGEGAEIAIVGNAERFGQTDTRVIYDVPADVGAARKLARALGGASVVREQRGPGVADVIDVTVVLGSDYEGTADEERGAG